MAQDTCGICNSDRRDELEAAGLLAWSGKISWREAVRRTGLNHHNSLKNHLLKHYEIDPADLPAPKLTFKDHINQTVEGLEQQLALAPIEIKPFYLAAIHNLLKLDKSQPSQKFLMDSLKAIQEVTGMKMEQRLLFAFAQEHFPALKQAEEREIPRGGPIIEVEAVVRSSSVPETNGERLVT